MDLVLSCTYLEVHSNHTHKNTPQKRSFSRILSVSLSAAAHLVSPQAATELPIKMRIPNDHGTSRGRLTGLLLLLRFWLVIFVLLLELPVVVHCESSSWNTVSIHPNLPFGDINVVVLTDVHSWLASRRRHEPYMDADMGDVLSFWERLKEFCDSNDMDLFFGTPCMERLRSSIKIPSFMPVILLCSHPCLLLLTFKVNNGDFVHGTGLSQMPGNPSYLIPLLEKMPYDAVNCGNHELYGDANVAYMMRPGGYVDWWGDRYLTSNIAVASNDIGDKTMAEMVLLGNPYKVLNGKHSDLLVFGFLYDMRDATPLVNIQRVEDVVQQLWFQKALKEEHYDAILVLAHMDLVDPLVDVIRSAIRKQIGDGMPVVFITGHTHYRGIKQLEDLSMSFEAGNYLNTVGFASFPGKESVRSFNSSELFQHAFLDTDRKVLFEETLGLSSASEGETRNGKELSRFIAETRDKLGLTEEIGCAPQSYFVEVYMEDNDSLWKLYRDEVIPKVFGSKQLEQQLQEDLPVAMMLSKGSWRYDLLNNATLIVDDIMVVAPFNDTVVYMGSFPASIILQVNRTINHGESKYGTWRRMLPDYILIGNVIREDASSSTLYHLYSHDFDATHIKSVLTRIAPDVTVEIKETPFRSTLLWMEFVRDYWSCDSALGKYSDWFSPSRHDHSVGGGSSSSTMTSGKRFAAMVVSVLLTAFVLALAYWLRPLTRRFFFSSRSSDPEEVVTLKEGGYLRKDPDGSCSDTAATDEDHETL